ncbi:Esc1p PWA37_001101 [Arxiozyma heterogenica]|uniref:Esc1p n=1 Tax=Arxiozyma heterogenica TaxID=278026 RepID=UPI002EFB572D
MTATNNDIDNTDNSSRNFSWSNKLTTPTRKWKPYQSLLKRRNGYQIGSQYYIQPLNLRSISIAKVTKTTKNYDYQISQEQLNKFKDQPALDTVTSEWIKDMIQRGKDILNKSRLKEQEIIHNRFKRYEEQEKIDKNTLDGNSFEPLKNYKKTHETGSYDDDNTNIDNIYTIEIDEKQDYENLAIESQLDKENEKVQEDDEQKQEDEENIDFADTEVSEDSEPSIIILTSEDEDEDEEKLESSHTDKEYNNDMFGGHESDKSNSYGEDECESESYEEEEEEKDNVIDDEDDNKIEDNDDNCYENMTVDFQKYMIPRNHEFNQNSNPSLNDFMSNEYSNKSEDNNINQNNTNLQAELATKDVVDGEYDESNGKQNILEQSQEEDEISLEEDELSLSTKEVSNREDIESQEKSYDDEEMTNDHYNEYLLPEQDLGDQESNDEEKSKHDGTHYTIIDDFSADDLQGQESLDQNSLENSNSIYNRQATSEEHIYSDNSEPETFYSASSLKNIAKNAISQIYPHLENQQFAENFDSVHELPIDVQSGSDKNEEDGQEFLHFGVGNSEIQEHESDLNASEQCQNIVQLGSEHNELKEETSDHQEIPETEQKKYEEEMNDSESSSTNNMSIYHSMNNESDYNVLTEVKVPSNNINMKNTDQYEIVISNSVYSNTSADTDNREVFPSNVTYVSPFSDDPFVPAEIDEVSKLKLQETLTLLSKTDRHKHKLESESRNRDNNNDIFPKEDKENNKNIDNIKKKKINKDNQTLEQSIGEFSQYSISNHEYKEIIENKILNNDSQLNTRVETINTRQKNINIDKNNETSHLLDIEKHLTMPNNEFFERSIVNKSCSEKINSEAAVQQYEHSQAGINSATEISEAIQDGVKSRTLSNIEELFDMKVKTISNPQNKNPEIVKKNLDSCIELDKDEVLQSGKDSLANSNQRSKMLLEKSEINCVTNNKSKNIIIAASESITPNTNMTDLKNMDMNPELEEQSNTDRTINFESCESKNDISIENKSCNTKVLSKTTNLSQPFVVNKIISSPIKAINALSVGVQKISNVANKFVEILDVGYSSDENESIIEIHSSPNVGEKDGDEENQEKQGTQNQSDFNAAHSMIDIEERNTENNDIKNMNNHTEELNKDLSNDNMLIQNNSMDEFDMDSTTYDIKSSLDVSVEKQNNSKFSSEEHYDKKDNVEEIEINANDNLQGLLDNLNNEKSQQNIAEEQTHQFDGNINGNENGKEITSHGTVTPSIHSSDLFAANKLFELAKEIDENTTVFNKGQITKQQTGFDDFKPDTDSKIQAIEKDERSELENYPINSIPEYISRIGTDSSSSIIASTTITAVPQESLEFIHKDVERLRDNKHTENKSIDEASSQLDTSNELPSDPPSDDNSDNQSQDKVAHEGDEHIITVKENKIVSKKEKSNDTILHISISESEDQGTENVPIQNHQNEKTLDNQTEISESSIDTDVSKANHAENYEIESKNSHSVLSDDNIVEPTYNNENISFEKAVSSVTVLDEPTKQENINKNKRKQKQKSSRHRKKRKVPITGSHVTSPGRSHKNETNKNNNKNNSNNRNNANNQQKHKKFKKNDFNHDARKFE